MRSQSQTSPIGCQRDAEKAFAGKLTLLAESNFRKVYVDRYHRTVYKVDIENWDDENNLEEAENSKKARELLGDSIPRVYLWYVNEWENGPRRIVLAMRYFGGNESKYYGKGEEYAHRMIPYFWDAKPDNIRYTANGEPRLIDLQFLTEATTAKRFWCKFGMHWFTEGEI